MRPDAIVKPCLHRAEAAKPSCSGMGVGRNPISGGWPLQRPSQEKLCHGELLVPPPGGRHRFAKADSRREEEKCGPAFAWCQDRAKTSNPVRSWLSAALSVSM